MKFRLDLKTYFLRPAELCFVREPSLIRTVLGSCVTITMFCRRTGSAAACHPVLPVCRSAESCQPGKCNEKFKYVECVVPEMVRRFQEQGTRLGELEVKLFGGANMFIHNSVSGRIIHVGNMNVSMARQKIDELQIPVKSYDVGGTKGRKLYFDTASGDVWVKRFEVDKATRDDRVQVQKQMQMVLNHER